MARKRISRNARCPCGSGKKYKHCCFRKDFEWMEDENGNDFKSVPLSDEMAELFEQHFQSFAEQHGREPDPEDLVFQDMPHLEHLEHEMIEAMKAAGLDPAVIYAAEKTGRLVSAENLHLLSDAEAAEWYAAIEEYRAEQGPPDPPEYPVGTIALYGPDETTTTKIAAGVILEEDAEIIVERWVATDVTENPKVQREIEAFFTKYGVKSVVRSSGNMGCPHEEGKDFPVGEDCPFCPFWKGKQGSNSRF